MIIIFLIDKWIDLSILVIGSPPRGEQ
ncbi:protein of unknown function [Candidatus Promineifilum breve]|uniref:Uncharacterized protein n=1 Tax=Candidatus Promineifilum breve TaxID=1806508 RepID=A0A160T685_9CHLR|nr:protein of unknown function [Candidatus Promineifilum breve]